MFKRARYFRWVILLLTVLVEVMAFWYGGPQTEQTLEFSEAVLRKLQHPSSWIWVGWASLSMAWLWAELAFIFYPNGRRTRALLRRSNHEKLVYDTGVHWLVLLRSIHLNQLNDGEKERLEAGLFPKDVRHSFAWHAIWWPVLLALLTSIYFLGWTAWSLKQIPDAVKVWSANSQGWIQERFDAPLAFVGMPLEQLTVFALKSLQGLHGLALQYPLATIGAIIGIWWVFRTFARLTSGLSIVGFLFNMLSRISMVAGVFALFSTHWFDWLSPIYNLFPQHGLAAMGYFPLTLASAFYFPHILFWSSWRYAIIRDTETYDATLMTLGGVFNSLQQRINLQRIVDTDIFQHWWQRLLNVGDIELKEMGGGEPERVRHVYGPQVLLEEIRNAIREGKMQSGQRSEFEDIGLDG